MDEAQNDEEEVKVEEEKSDVGDNSGDNATDAADVDGSGDDAEPVQEADSDDDSDDESGDSQEVAEQSSQILSALLPSLESLNFNDEFRLALAPESEGGSEDDLKEFAELFKLYWKTKESKPALESVELTSFGLKSFIGVIDDTNAAFIEPLIKDLPKKFRDQISNMLVVAKRGCTKMDELTKAIVSAIDKGESEMVCRQRFTWGPYGRQWLINGVPITSIDELARVHRYQSSVHQYLFGPGIAYFNSCLSAFTKFMKSAVSDDAWDKGLSSLYKEIQSIDNALIKSQVTLAKTGALICATPERPKVLDNRKPLSRHSVIAALTDNVYLCSSEIKRKPLSLSEFVNMGFSLERIDFPKNPEAGINDITASKLLELIKVSRHGFDCAAAVEARIGEVFSLVDKFIAAYSDIKKSDKFALSPALKLQADFACIYLMETIANPLLANMWQACRMSHSSLFLAMQVMPQENIHHNLALLNQMTNGKINITAALENLENGDALQPPVAIVEGDLEKSMTVDAAAIPDGVDLAPEDEGAIADSVDMANSAMQLSSTITAMESIVRNCENAIAHQTAADKRRTIVAMESNYSALCDGIGIKKKFSVGVESEGGEDIALEGIIDKVVDTIKNIGTSIKNLWKTFVNKIEDDRLREKSRRGDIDARVTLIKKYSTVLPEAAGLEITDKSVMANLGLWAKIDTPIKAMMANLDYQKNYGAYIVGSMEIPSKLGDLLRSTDASNNICEVIQKDIEEFKKLCFPEKKNRHAIDPRMSRDQSVSFAPDLPGSSVPALITPNELFPDGPGVGRVEEVRFVDLSSGVRRDLITKIAAASVKDVEDVSGAIGYWTETSEKFGALWAKAISGANNAGSIAESIYQSASGRDSDAVKAANAFYVYLARFMAQVLVGFEARAALNYSTMNAAMAWLEASIEAGNAAVRAKPKVSND